ncbi:ABC transporter ATP-binding protein [Aliidiomarina minuta]|uniref:ABC transporter ATP-binding protein n=1 Tax=Aliidiomarina minuta TaxID=880057 RepID=A0A432W6R4_9GAMM|nr:ABC transporter ATP-binding protein [Aliidiomarina minuta]RUO25757.1 ABC transporter ATP-binding protein [Aliidiomarina minuta]
MVTQPIIKVRGLNNRFGDLQVHEKLELDVMQGEVLCVVGGSGSGKSVLMRSILGLHRPDSGRIEVLDKDVLNLPDNERQLIERKFGVLFQKGALFSSLSVRENIALPMREHAGLSKQEADELASMKLALVGLDDSVGEQSPQQLSGGMIKRVALARALALDPEILFLDEPTAGLDPIGAGAFDHLLKTLQQALGLTVFLVTHDLDTIFTVSDRVAVLAQKKVLVADRLERVAAYDDEWIQSYFHGPRGRALIQTKNEGQ